MVLNKKYLLAFFAVACPAFFLSCGNFLDGNQKNSTTTGGYAPGGRAGINCPSSVLSTTVFAYTGATQSFSGSCACVEIKAWGGGGANSINGGAGGGGGFAKGLFAYNGPLTVYVAGRGVGMVGGFGRGSGGATQNTNWDGGAGGGASAVTYSGTPLLVAGGGGGGGGAMVNNTLAYAAEAAGGAGGGENGTANGSCALFTGRLEGQGGLSGNNGGTGGAGAGAGPAGSNGSAASGDGGAGAPNGGAGNDSSGGGGGGGYVGGGGGGSPDNGCEGSGGGGGGSSFVSADAVANSAVLVSGSGTTPGRTSDSDYAGNAGRGGAYDASFAAVDGRVVINCY